MVNIDLRSAGTLRRVEEMFSDQEVLDDDVKEWIGSRKAGVPGA